MCDALSRNLPRELETILANCLAHARREFVDLTQRFKSECQYVLEAFRIVYHNDAVAQAWNDHFQLQGSLIVGKTPVGRTTVHVLNMNAEEEVERRSLE